MTNPLFAEELVRQHQQEMLADAARARLIGRTHHARRPWWVMSWRQRAGRVLIRAGASVAGPGLAVVWRDAAS